jgi:glutamate/tyrosine decarboxylase-like PLP-dependent enzyme
VLSMKDPATHIRPGADTPDLLRHTAELAIAHIDSLPMRPVGAPGLHDPDSLRRALGGPLPQLGTPARKVVDELVEALEPGLSAMAGPRYFGFVVGGALPAALAADWMTSAWDQMSGLYVGSPAAAIVEEIAAAWVLELLGLPAGSSVGFTTGATMANFTALAAARHALLRRVGWDVEAEGLQGAPRMRVIVGADVHASLLLALRYAGFGAGRAERAATDAAGRILASSLAPLLHGSTGPTIVCAQLGEVNTGACDPLREIAAIVRGHPNAWLHVDGAFGLWAAASPALRGLVEGHDLADSWSTDAHKWLNVPYDNGLVIVRDAAAHRAAMGVAAAYLPPAPGDLRDPFDWVPEMSRRARAFTVYAAIRQLGADGVAAIVERCHALAVRLAEHLAAEPGIRILNEVVLNQVLIEVGDASLTAALVASLAADGTMWAGATTFHSRAALRVSVSNWSSRDADIDAAGQAIIGCLRSVRDRERRPGGV